MGIGRWPTFQLVLVDVSNIVLITTTLLAHIWCIWIEVLRWVHEPYDRDIYKCDKIVFYEGVSDQER